ncbi:hypothetical protein [Niveispirillum sp.]|uniref:hypothetical protein n=1 Tax=Niveispirillum sp. TaxID=1917217 RepID=UPI001B627E63|nr:hypothetical protein [Niveispirillum sp.]MBP7339305.1 hypothetical protein [Niveispirillum sp.]
MKDRRQRAVEWTVGALSGVLVLCLILFLGHEAVFGEVQPARLVVSIAEIEPMDGGTMVTVTVMNQGDKAAAAVTVNASLKEATAPDKQIEFDYIAAHAVRRGAFLFPHPVNHTVLDIQIGGFTEL